MKYSETYYKKFASYTSPFSGHTTGVATYKPVGVEPDNYFTLHETGFLKARPHWNYPRVFSPFWRYYYDLEAGHHVVFPKDKKTVALGPDKVVIIPDHQLFHTVGTVARPKFWIAFSTALRLSNEQSIPVQLTPSVLELGLIRSLTRLLRNKEKHQLEIHHLSLALLHITLSKPSIRWTEKQPVELLAAIQYMEDHYMKALTHAEIARVARCSERTLDRLFIRHQGVAPKRYLAHVRVRAVAHLLLNGQASIEQIAEQTGFPNRQYLTRVFTQVTGESPAFFRRTHGLEH